MKLKTKNKFLKVIILFLLAVLLLDKIKDAFSLLIELKLIILFLLIVMLLDKIKLANVCQYFF